MADQAKVWGGITSHINITRSALKCKMKLLHDSMQYKRSNWGTIQETNNFQQNKIHKKKKSDLEKVKRKKEKKKKPPISTVRHKIIEPPSQKPLLHSSNNEIWLSYSGINHKIFLMWRGKFGSTVRVKNNSIIVGIVLMFKIRNFGLRTD